MCKWAGGTRAYYSSNIRQLTPGLSSWQSLLQVGTVPRLGCLGCVKWDDREVPHMDRAYCFLGPSILLGSLLWFGIHWLRQKLSLASWNANELSWLFPVILWRSCLVSPYYSPLLSKWALHWEITIDLMCSSNGKAAPLAIYFPEASGEEGRDLEALLLGGLTQSSLSFSFWFGCLKHRVWWKLSDTALMNSKVEKKAF